MSISLAESKIATEQATPIYSNDGTAYLEMVRHGRGIRVRRTEAGVQLDRFWTVWLWKQILKIEPQGRYAVVVEKHAVIVRGGKSYGALMGTIQSVATEIVPLPNKAPLTKNLDMCARSGDTDWYVGPGIDIGFAIEGLKLPGRVEVSCGNGAPYYDQIKGRDVWQSGFVHIHQMGKRELPIWHLALMVEFHVALYFNDRS